MNDQEYIKHLEETVKSLTRTVESLEIQVENLTELLKITQKALFGTSSEKRHYEEDSGDQLSIFNEAEAEADPSVKEPARITVAGHVRKNLNTKREQLIKDLPVREVICDMPDEEKFCGQCGSPLKPIGKEKVREELEYIPAKLQIVRYVRISYECPECRKTDNPYIVKSLAPTSLMNHSLASPSSVANVMYQKYVNGMPLYRQEKEWHSMGLDLSRATMANWVIRCAEDYMYPVIDYLHRSLLDRDIVHCDETPVQVLKEDGRKPESKSYMWLYRTGNDGLPPIVIYDYQPSRGGFNAADYLDGFSGYVHSDGYSGYNRLAGITRCGCWAHLRRKFNDAVPDSKKKGSAVTAAEQGVEYCSRLFEIERTLKDMDSDKRYLARLEAERPLLDEFWEWLDSVNALKGSALGRAVTYARNQKKYMENYLLDGRLEISNNAAENSIRPFTVGRKNWLFSDTPKGASASAAVYSIVETAKANGLEVRSYLEYLLQYMPDIQWREDAKQLEAVMPWNENVKAQCSEK